MEREDRKSNELTRLFENIVNSMKKINGPCEREEDKKEGSHGQCSKDPFLKWMEAVSAQVY